MYKINLTLTVILLLVLNLSCTQKQVENSKTELVDLVYPHLDSENSRWFFFTTASRPFGMVNLSPDTQIGGAWGSGYRYNTDTVKGFSHIHAWQLSGLSLMPFVLDAKTEKDIYTDFYSPFSHATEKAEVGYHYLELDRFGITAELSSTKRVGFHKYTFSEGDKPAILFNLNGALGPSKIVGGVLKQVDETTLEGQFINNPTIRRPKPTTVFFQIKVNTAIAALRKDENTGNYYIELEKAKGNEILMKAAISYTSNENAAKNMEGELAHWDFEKVVAESKAEWNNMLGRIEIEGGTETQQRRFYTDLWHALQGRRVISDINGAYPDNTGDEFRVGQIPLENGKPKFNQYNSDSFWGAQWTLNTLWGLVYPEIYEEFVHSMMQYYHDGGMVPRGPSGGNYTYVMTGATATPFVVSAIQKGIITENLEEIYQALKKGHMEEGIMAKAGYEHKTSIGGGLNYYMENGYVPHPNPKGMRFGFHQNGPGMTVEYSLQDWTLAQLAKKLGHNDDYDYFMERSLNYKNVYNPELGYLCPKNIDGEWMQDYDIFVGPGFVESNAAQSTWFGAHDIAGLAELMGGKEAAAEKLNGQFEVAKELDFTAGKAHAQESHEKHKRIPINYGNQPSIQTAFIFHHLDRPDLSQYWSRQVIEQAFSGFSTNSGYNGDEDQGLMSSLSVIMKLGLFQLQTGADEKAVYQIGSPLFKKASIQLNPNYYAGGKLIIEAEGAGQQTPVVKIAKWNGADFIASEIDHETLVKGGTLSLSMGGKD